MLDVLETILGRLGAHMLAWRSQGLTQGRWEGAQLKAWADEHAHAFLLAELGQAFPGIPVLSEEDESLHGIDRPDEYWLIDPIDGTASFCGGFDGFVTQAALMRHSAPAVAGVHAPALGLMYTAQLGGLAKCNGRVLATLEGTCKPVLIDNYPEPRGVAKRLYDELPCRGYIESGSLGLKICRVADRTAGLFVKDVIVKDWDLAPGQLVLECAGGVLTDFNGTPVDYQDGFERFGVVASADTGLARRVDTWRRSCASRQ